MIVSIEAPCTLLQKPVKVLLFDAIKLAQMRLCLVPKIFDTIDMILLMGKEPEND